MATEQGPNEFDLDRTDRLPVLTGISLDGAEDDLDRAQPVARLSAGESHELDAAEATGRLRAIAADRAGPPSMLANGGLQVADFIRSSAIDLPSLAESVRTVEERIARQHADYETLSRSYERARDAETVALAKAASFERELATLRAGLEAEQARLRQHEQTLRERDSVSQAARSMAEEALRETERFRSESSTLRDTLAAREATIAQVVHTLGERDAQLESLKQEHKRVQQALDSRSKSQAELEQELARTRTRADQLAEKLKAAEQGSAALGQKARRNDAEINALRAELGSTRATSHSYLELLRSREFRRGFDETLFMELDARLGSADSRHARATAQRDQAQGHAANLEIKIASQSETIDKLQQTATIEASTVAQQAQDLKRLDDVREQLTQKLAIAESERARLAEDLAERSRQLEEAQAATSGDLKRVSEQLQLAQMREKELTAQIAQLQAEHADRLSRLHAEHAEKLIQIQADNTERFTKLQCEYAQVTSKMHSDHAEIMSRTQGDQATQLAEIQARHAGMLQEMSRQAQEREQEMSVLMAHLKEARRPIEPILADVEHLTEELATKSRLVEELSTEVQQLRGSLERTKGALEEREFLIRRLERAESSNANVLGRIQTSMERLGSAPVVGAASGDQTEWSAEMVRLDGEREISHALGRRTRIGRGEGCELQIDSSSVSRQHALIVAGPRETIIEDLNSTNGVIVNGRKISRAFLNDGDVVLVGEVQFRYASKGAARQERVPIEIRPAS